MVSYDGTVYKTGVAIGTATTEITTRAGKLLRAQRVYEHRSSHDKYNCKKTMPFCCIYRAL